MIDISVIVPVYNSESTLRKCVDSLLCQSLRNIEIILVDDGSHDNSYAIMEEYGHKYSNIRILKHEVNRGIGKTRNDGIEAATGRYLTFVDSDDWIEENMLETFLNYAIQHNVDFISSNFNMIENGQVRKYTYTPYPDCTIDSWPEVLTVMSYGPCNKLFASDIIKDNNIRFEETLKYEDVPFVAKAMKHSRMGFVDDCLYNYLIHEGSQTTVMDSRSWDIFKVLDIVNNYYHKKPYAELEGMNVANVTWHMMKHRDVKDSRMMKEFIHDSFAFLNENFPDWRKNVYFMKEGAKSRLVKSSESLMVLYCTAWRKLHG